MTIVERIKFLRKEVKLTQAQFASRAGLSQNAIARYEIGNRQPRKSTILAICKAFNVNYNWLVNGQGEIFLPEEKSSSQDNL